MNKHVLDKASCEVNYFSLYYTTGHQAPQSENFSSYPRYFLLSPVCIVGLSVIFVSSLFLLRLFGGKGCYVSVSYKQVADYEEENIDVIISSEKIN